jgi:two-component system, OmpR family, KDP operon response regulator KdpE
MTGIAARVLVVDDEPQILRALRAALTGHGYEVQTASSGGEALDTIAVRPPDVVILDLVMPGTSGFAVVQDVRTWSHVPIVVLSARGQEQDKVTALDLGADDYLTKPFGMDELLARIRVALRHRAGTSDGALIVRAGNVTIDLAGRAVTRNRTLVHLTPTEWRLLAELARNADRVLTHGMLLARVWGPMFTGEPQYLRVFINQLRRKLEADPAEPRIIATEPGVGYRLVAEE